MNEESAAVDSSFILHPSSFILHPSEGAPAPRHDPIQCYKLRLTALTRKRRSSDPTEETTDMIAVSKMADAVQPSATLAAGAKARQMKAEGITVYDFSLGEPDFATPEHICAAAVNAMKKGQTRYTPASGISELRAA